jgi:hypothetical protein
MFVNWLANWIETLFGCWHSNYSFPITLKAGRTCAGAGRRRTYVVCLGCGKELAYDWNRMKVVTREANTVLRSHSREQLVNVATDS